MHADGWSGDYLIPKNIFIFQKRHTNSISFTVKKAEQNPKMYRKAIKYKKMYLTS